MINFNSELAPFIAVAVISHPIYVYGTTYTKEITVTKKYKYTSNGNTEFMIIDRNNCHYNVGNSFWYWKWDSIEDWSNIDETEGYKIKYYGVRFPLLGLFPVIVETCDKPLNLAWTISENARRRTVVD